MEQYFIQQDYSAGEVFIKQEVLDDSVRTNEIDSPPKLHQCFCGKSFGKLSSLKDHESTHEMYHNQSSDNQNQLNGESNAEKLLKLSHKMQNSALLDGKFFKPIETKNCNSIEAQCQLCLPKYTIIKGSLNPTTNFIKHLKALHLHLFHEYERYKIEKKENRKNYLNMEYSFEIGESKHKPSLFPMQNMLYNNGPQIEFDKKIIKFIVDTNSMNLIEKSSFVDLFNGSNLTVMNQETAYARIDQLFEDHENKLRNQLNKYDFLCITVDIWMINGKRYLGISAHFITEYFKRHSMAIGCERIFETTDRNSVIEKIYLKLNINKSKIVACITGNGSKVAVELNDELNYSNQRIVHFEEGPIGAIKQEIVYKLCQIAEEDTKMSIYSDSFLGAQHTGLMNKCHILWNKSYNRRSFDQIKQILGYPLKTPISNSWSSYFDSLNHILIEKDRLNILLQNLEVNEFFEETEISYLEEYILILQEISIALNKLKEDSNQFYGYILPTIITLKVKFEKLKNSENLKYTRNLLECCIQGLTTRFSDYFLLSNKVDIEFMAAVSSPNFKLRWFNVLKDSCPSNLLDIKNKFSNLAEIVLSEEFQTEITAIKQESDSFFDFNEKVQTGDGNNSFSAVNILRNKIDLELIQYLDDPRVDLSMLESYPVIKKIFLRFNTPLSTSESVKRLFSFDSFPNQILPDELFEKMILLKANNVL